MKNTPAPALSYHPFVPSHPDSAYIQERDPRRWQAGTIDPTRTVSAGHPGAPPASPAKDTFDPELALSREESPWDETYPE